MVAPESSGVSVLPSWLVRWAPTRVGVAGRVEALQAQGDAGGRPALGGVEDVRGESCHGSVVVRKSLESHCLRYLACVDSSHAASRPPRRQPLATMCAVAYHDAE